MLIDAFHGLNSVQTRDLLYLVLSPILRVEEDLGAKVEDTESGFLKGECY